MTSNPAGITCGADCSETWASGTFPALTATPAPGSKFTGWSGGGCTGTGACTIYYLVGNSTVTANFAPDVPPPAGDGRTNPIEITGTTFTDTRSTVEHTAAADDPTPSCTGRLGHTVWYRFTPSRRSRVTISTIGSSHDTVISLHFASNLVTAGCNDNADGLTSRVETTVYGNTTYLVMVGSSGAGPGGDLAFSLSLGPELYTFSVPVLGPGTVTSDPPGISCGADCTERYPDGTVVTLTATPDPGAVFVGWGGSCGSYGGPVSPVCTVTVVGDDGVSAFFEPTYPLTVARAGAGSGRVTSVPAGVSCGVDCSRVYPRATQVALTASPDHGSVFKSWSGACVGAGACTATVLGPTSVTATFDLAVYPLNVTAAGDGVVTSRPAGISCGTRCTHGFAFGTSVTLVAHPAPGATFLGWDGACAGAAGACTATVNDATSVTASFSVPDTARLTVTRRGTGSGTVTSVPPGIVCGDTCAGTHVGGTIATLTATPDPDSTFGGWGGACSGVGACAVTMDTARFVSATFQRRPAKLWAPDGVPVTTASGVQTPGDAVSDGAGGAILVWPDHRASHGNPDVFGQRLDSAAGEPRWPVDGALIATARSLSGEETSQGNPRSASDGAGGAILAWEDTRTGQSDIFAQRVGPDGLARWPASGVPVSTACWTGGLCANAKRDVQIVSDMGGGAIVVWGEMRDGFHLSVWAQRVSAAGQPLWTGNGVPVVSGAFNADFPEVASDGAGGAIVAWQDDRSATDTRIRAQRVAPDGRLLWGASAVEVSPRIGHRGAQGHAVISDEEGGAIVAWTDNRIADPNGTDVYAQRLDASGAGLWPAGGVAVVTRRGGQRVPALVSDGAGGAIVVWEDSGASPPGSGRQYIYAQRISGAGEPLWPEDGIAVYAVHGSAPQLVSDGDGGAVAVWDGFRVSGSGAEERFVGPSIFSQRITGDGEALWGENGFEVYHQPNGSYGFGPRAVADGSRGVIVHWTDYRLTGGGAQDIFAQRVGDQSSPAAAHALTITRGGTGGGTVTSDPTGIACGADCEASAASGTIVTLTAMPDASSTFERWSGCDVTAGPVCTVALTAARSIAATFGRPMLRLTVARTGAGRGRIVSVAAGLDCSATCVTNRAGSEVITLVAVAAAGSRFTGWRGACAGTGPCTVTLTAARSVSATFTRVPMAHLSVHRRGTGIGAVTSHPSGVQCGAQCTASYERGAAVTLTASAATGSKFTGWRGACAGTGPCTLTMSGSRLVIATFAKD